jgi:hypothetical protein
MINTFFLLIVFVCVSVNPIYFVCFTTATIIASAILFQGFNTDNPTNIASLICGFVIIFTGVYLLDSIARSSPSNADDYHLHSDTLSDVDNEDEEEFLMGEAALLDENELGSSSLNLSGLNHDSDEDIELIMRPKHGH